MHTADGTSSAQHTQHSRHADSATPHSSDTSTLSSTTVSASCCMSTNELCQAAWALLSMGWQPNSAWVSSLLRAAHPQLPGATLLSTATLLRVLAAWGCKCEGSGVSSVDSDMQGSSDDHQQNSDLTASQEGSSVHPSSSNVHPSNVSQSSTNTTSSSPPLIPRPWLDAAAATIESCTFASAVHVNIPLAQRAVVNAARANQTLGSTPFRWVV